jgi:hypothetical protein
VIACKIFPLEEQEGGEKKKKMQIKAKYTISDGVSSVKALVPESNYKKLVSSTLTLIFCSVLDQRAKNF